MGEVIRNLARVRIGGKDYRIELNVSTSKRGEREIHIQNDSFRLAIPENEFLHMSAAVLLAKKQLEQIKGQDAATLLGEK